MANPLPTSEYHRVFLQLAKTSFPDLESGLEVITRVDADALAVDRVSAWLFDRERTAIVCEKLYHRSTESYEKGQILRRECYPRYFSALEENRTLAALDARIDPRTSEFTPDYLIPNGITAMLDAPIWLNGEFIGIVCHEHVGSQRGWSAEEQAFAASIADLVSLTIDSIHRRKAEEDLRRAYDELEIRVRERTAELARANEDLAFLANHDGLTGLPNRALFEDRLKQMMAQCRRSGERFALMFLDMDFFKAINDGWGHRAGDAVLKEVAVRLKNNSRDADTVARVGGDEFIVLLSQIQGRDDVRIFSERIRRALQDPILFEGTQHQVTLSIGAAIYPDDGEESLALVTRADRALYEAKNTGRNGPQSFQAVFPY
ncbi:MAG TPA: diguanylate cyclase [bacterium]|nr:diguanylate cyclase [bacterium]